MVLLACYRRSDTYDPAGYVAAIALVLSDYDDEIIMQVTDPRTGIQIHDKFKAFPPNSGELKAYCEAYAKHRERVEHYKSLPPVRPLPAKALPFAGDKPAGRLANLLVRKTIPGYERMVERAKTADPAEWCWHPEGIKVPVQWWSGGGAAIGPAEPAQFRMGDKLAAICARNPDAAYFLQGQARDNLGSKPKWQPRSLQELAKESGREITQAEIDALPDAKPSFQQASAPRDVAT
jgi:hypothetical protein